MAAVPDSDQGVTHRDNIQRLLDGTERKFSPGDRTPTAPPGSDATGAGEADESERKPGA